MSHCIVSLPKRCVTGNRALTFVIINQSGKGDKTPKGEINSSDNTYILLALNSLQNKDLRLTYLFPWWEKAIKNGSETTIGQGSGIKPWAPQVHQATCYIHFSVALLCLLPGWTAAVPGPQLLVLAGASRQGWWKACASGDTISVFQPFGQKADLWEVFPSSFSLLR